MSEKYWYHQKKWKGSYRIDHIVTPWNADFIQAYWGFIHYEKFISILIEVKTKPVDLILNDFFYKIILR